MTGIRKHKERVRARKLVAFPIAVLPDEAARELTTRTAQIRGKRLLLDVSRQIALTPPGGHAKLCYVVRQGDYVKIGCSSCVAGRIRGMRIGTPFPFEIVCILPGGQPMEAFLHRRLRENRVTGEWFGLDAHTLKTFYSLGEHFRVHRDRVAEKLGLKFKLT